MHQILDNRNIRTAESEWDSGIAFADGSNTHRLIKALLEEYERVDDDINNIYHNHHINSATGQSLDKFGELVQIDRETGESDSRYRARIKAAFRVGNIGTTFDEFSQFSSAILNTDIDNLTFIEDYPGKVTVSAPTAVYDNTELTDTDVVQILSEAVPAGHTVTAVEGGTFRLKSDGAGDDADKGLTSDSISTGGTLATDLVE